MVLPALGLAPVGSNMVSATTTLVRSQPAHATRLHHAPQLLQAFNPTFYALYGLLAWSCASYSKAGGATSRAESMLDTLEAFSRFRFTIASVETC